MMACQPENMMSMDEKSFDSGGSDLESDERHKQTVRLAKGLAAHNMKPLPENYELGEHDVICGRGRKCFNHIGNVRFRKMVADLLPKYSDAAAKLEKTYIICDVVNCVRKNSPNGGFVKKDPMSGIYFEVGDFLAREKTSQAFRDALHDQYKSSNAAKKKRRLKDQAQKLHRQASAPTLMGSSDFADLGESSSSINMQNVDMQNAHNYSLDDYATNNSKFMRVDRPQFNMGTLTGEDPEPAMNLLLGELDNEISASFSNVGGRNKRQMFASQKSVTSIIDETKQNSSAPAWFNRSCPNLAGQPAAGSVEQATSLLSQFKVEEEPEEEEEPDLFSRPTMNVMSGADWHHSQPNLFAQPVHMFEGSAQENPVACGRPNLLLNRMRNKKAQSVRNLMGPSSGYDLYERPQKMRMRTEQQPIHHEDIMLSPIGDGNPNSLFDKLKGFGEDLSETNTGDMFDPIPF